MSAMTAFALGLNVGVLLVAVGMVIVDVIVDRRRTR